MPKDPTHRAPSGPASPALTFADLVKALETSNGLSPVRIRDLRSAISRFAALANQEPKQIPLDLEIIRAKLHGINPVAAGISQKTLANIRSDLLAAMKASGLKPVRPTSHPLSDPWRELIKWLATKRQRIGISRLARYASSVGLHPGDINDAAIGRFMTSVREGSLHRKPNDLHRKTSVIWNEIVAAASELVLNTVTIPSFRPAPLRIDWTLLPEGFRKDIERYLDWCSSTDPFAVDARRRPLAPPTVQLRRDELHAAITALADSGVKPTSLRSIADLVAVENFTKIARRRHELAGSKENTFNRKLVEALVQIAREWVKVDVKTLTELKQVASKVPAPRADLTAKNKRFLRQFDDPKILERLRAVARKLWSQAMRDAKPSFRTLAKAQAAIAIEILIYMPIRLKNLAELTFDVHLFLREGPNAASTLEITADEVKNKRPIEFDIPPQVARMLALYRDQIAQRVIGRRPERLFVNPDGAPKHSKTVAGLITKAARRHAGIELTPHQFRHLAAKILLDDSPGAFELVRQLLGHENLKTTANFYAGMDTRRAARHHADLLAKMSADQRNVPVSRHRSRSKLNPIDRLEGR